MKSVTGIQLAAVALALVTLVMLARAAAEWEREGAEPPAAPSGGSRRRGGVILLFVLLVLLGGLWAVAGPAGWPRDRVLWVGFGAFLAGMTLTRPWWFWGHYKARWLRGLIGDEATAFLYLLLAGAMVWIGLFTNWSFGRR
ncbi:MAG TPA: hypothetical protein VFW66_10520 [Gemmatimonadales bacterium]|nr:hypothetical protein [Gemmatimonadales bacterium]